MLNELYSMSQSLERCRLQVPSRHERLKKNPNVDAFIIGIGKDGLVDSVEFCHKARTREIFNIDSGENGVSFPGFKLSGPLWLFNESAQALIEKLLNLKKDMVSERLALLEQIVRDAAFATDCAEDRYLRRNLHGFPAEVRQMFADCPAEYSVLSDLLARLTESSGSEEAFLRSLSEAGMQAYRKGRFSVDATLLLQDLLLGKWESKNRRFVASKIAVILEPSGGKSYPFAITHPNTEKFINEQMSGKFLGKSFAKGGKGSVIKSGLDSLRGGEVEIQTRFPDPNLPVIGNTKLMSMTKDSLCQTRYGLQESDTFPVGKNTTQVMLDALTFLTQEERKGRTWRGVPNAEEKGRDLLIVYLEDVPDTSINLADFFAQDDDSLAEGKFEATAQKVCDALEGEPAVNPDSLLRVIVISSRDKGRKQVALNEVFQVKQILRSAEEWQLAGANHPPVSILLIPKKGEKYRIASPICPPPAALLKCFNNQWTNGGTKSVWVSSCEIGQVYEIFLQSSAHAQSTAERLLTLALQRAGNLLLAIGNRQHSGNWTGTPDSPRFAALTALSTLAILLFKTGHRKENFMPQAPFNIGRLLSLADQLHALYCKEVRSGDVPPQLFGNALMSTALQQPITALSLFAQRVLPYWTWADTVQSGESVGLAKYFLKEMRAVSQVLSVTKLPGTLSDAERAEMILGYLASPKSENKESQ